MTERKAKIKNKISIIKVLSSLLKKGGKHNGKTKIQNWYNGFK